MLHNINGKLHRNGIPFRHIGVNGYELFFRYGQGYDTPIPIWKTAIDLIKSYDIKVCRTILLGPSSHHFTPYFNDPTAYKLKIKDFLDYAAQNNIEIVATLNAGWQGLSDGWCPISTSMECT